MSVHVERIGDATLYLGDCRDVLADVGSVKSIISDPPYGMGFRSAHRTISYEPIANDGSSEMLRFACSISATHSSYIFCRWDNISELPKPKSLVTWIKNNWSMGNLKHEHARQTEVILFYPGPEHRFPQKRPSDVIRAPRTSNKHHPTEKPVLLLMTIVGWTEGTVIDPFMGSGSTGIACVKMRRPFIGIESDPKYFDVARKRIEAAHLRPSLFGSVP